MGYLLEYGLICMGFLLTFCGLVIRLHQMYSLEHSLISNKFLLDIYMLVRIRILEYGLISMGLIMDIYR